VAGEHDRDLVGTSERELIGQHALKRRPASGGTVEHSHVGDHELS
jgi:hypothetical protein